MMGACHDQLGMVDPYGNNLKLIHRQVCRHGLPWDDKLGKDEEDAIIKACSFFFAMADIEFERRAIFSEAKAIIFLFYLDGSGRDLNGVTVIV